MPEKKEQSFFSNDDFTAESERGRGLRDRPQSILPKLPRPTGRDVLGSALVGLRESLSAVQEAAKLGDPLTAVLAGFAGGAGAPTPQAIANQREGQAAELQSKLLDNMAVDEVSPKLTERFPELKGIPLGVVNKIAPLLQKQEQYEQLLNRLALQQAFQREMVGVRGEESRKNIDAAAKARENLDTIDDNSAIFYQQSTGIPADVFVGQRRRDMNTALRTLPTAQKQAESLKAAKNTIAELKRQWDEIASDVGPAEGRAFSALAKISGGKIGGKVANYEAAREAAVTTIRSLFNDSGAPSNFDVSRLLNAIPPTSLDSETAANRWANAFNLQATGEAALTQSNPLAQYFLRGSLSAPGGAPGGGLDMNVIRQRAQAELERRRSSGGAR